MEVLNKVQAKKKYCRYHYRGLFCVWHLLHSAPSFFISIFFNFFSSFSSLRGRQMNGWMDDFHHNQAPNPGITHQHSTNAACRCCLHVRLNWIHGYTMKLYTYSENLMGKSGIAWKEGLMNWTGDVKLFIRRTFTHSKYWQNEGAFYLEPHHSGFATIRSVV